MKKFSVFDFSDEEEANADNYFFYKDDRPSEDVVKPLDVAPAKASMVKRAQTIGVSKLYTNLTDDEQEDRVGDTLLISLKVDDKLKNWGKTTYKETSLRGIHSGDSFSLAPNHIEMDYQNKRRGAFRSLTYHDVTRTCPALLREHMARERPRLANCFSMGGVFEAK